jgi:dTDP-glucose pyrophosphorylase
MNFVIPMAGSGRRFAEAGWRQPKWAIEAHGKSLLQWSVDSLPLALATRLVFVALREHEECHGLSRRLAGLYGGRVPVRLHLLDRVTRGQAETVWLARDECDARQPLAIFNIDTAFDSPTLAAALQDPASDGVLGAFHSSEARFSFARLGSDGGVVETAEKRPISDLALTGFYHFRFADDFFSTAARRIDRDQRDGGEFYIAPMYNDLIAAGRRFTVDLAASHHILGTPAELQAFLDRDPP